MSYTTTVHKHVECPLWKEEITLSGKYLFYDEVDKEYEAKFISATCPICENLHQPRSKKNPDYEMFTYCNKETCDLLDDFEPFIDCRLNNPL